MSSLGYLSPDSLNMLNFFHLFFLHTLLKEDYAQCVEVAVFPGSKLNFNPVEKNYNFFTPRYLTLVMKTLILIYIFWLVLVLSTQHVNILKYLTIYFKLRFFSPPNKAKGFLISFFSFVLFFSFLNKEFVFLCRFGWNSERILEP